MWIWDFFFFLRSGWDFKCPCFILLAGPGLLWYRQYPPIYIRHFNRRAVFLLVCFWRGRNGRRFEYQVYTRGETLRAKCLCVSNSILNMLATVCLCVYTLWAAAAVQCGCIWPITFSKNRRHRRPSRGRPELLWDPSSLIDGPITNRTSIQPQVNIYRQDPAADVCVCISVGCVCVSRDFHHRQKLYKMRKRKNENT
jgi:hypothetical protein